ncbi:hypothetical protein AM256_12645 [Burkholderia pseudomallei]|nr:hypothetical protein AM256_12645 [Burkholderia pseudomallei]
MGGDAVLHAGDWAYRDARLCPSIAVASAINRRPPTADCRPPTADRRPPTADRQPPTANRQPPTANRQPPTANRQPPTANRRLATGMSVGGACLLSPLRARPPPRTWP